MTIEKMKKFNPEEFKPFDCVLNDINERNTPVLGGDFAFIEWDESAGYHCNLGDIAISERSPRQVIPQPDITDIDKMDYIFITSHVTKKYVKKHYGIDVSEAQNEFHCAVEYEIWRRLGLEDFLAEHIKYFTHDPCCSRCPWIYLVLFFKKPHIARNYVFFCI